MLALLALAGCRCDGPTPTDAGQDAGLDATDAALPPCERRAPPRNEGACSEDAECADGDLCAPVDATPGAVFGCAAGVGAPPGADCTTSAECAHGLCAAAGRCVAPCAGEDREGLRCARVKVWAGATLREVSAWVPARALPTGADVNARDFVGDELTLSAGAGLHVVVPECAPRPRAVELAQGAMTLWRDRPEDPNPVFAEGGAPLAVALPAGDQPLPTTADVLLRLDRQAEGAHAAITRAPAAGRLDVEIYYLGGGGLAPAGDRGPPEVEAMLDRAFLLLGPDVLPGEVRQHAVDDAHRGRLAVLEAERGVLAELPELFALAAGADDPHVAIFLVRDIDFRIAFSGGIPGPLGHPGVQNAGVVLAFDALSGLDPGRVLAHELAHHLGLFHLTEFDGTVFEPLSDTPECEDADDDGTVTVAECEGMGADNLMFWSAEAEGTTLTEAQRAVLRRAPILR